MGKIVYKDENFYLNHCKTCRDSVHCCIFKDKSGFAFIGIKDAKLISKHIKKDYAHFLDYSPFSNKLVNVLKNEDPLLEAKIRHSQLDKHNRLLRLKTQKDGRCVFLNDKGKCEIYNIRPNICRIYPFFGIKLINGKIKMVSHDIDSKCGVVKSVLDNDELNYEKISKKELLFLKKVYKKIVLEDEYYRKNIKKFIDTANLA